MLSDHVTWTEMFRALFVLCTIGYSEAAFLEEVVKESVLAEARWGRVQEYWRATMASFHYTWAMEITGERTQKVTPSDLSPEHVARAMQVLSTAQAT